MSRADRLAAEALAREVRDLMDMGVPRHVAFERWLADYFMRFAATVTLDLSDHATAERVILAWRAGTLPAGDVKTLLDRIAGRTPWES